MNVSRLYSFSKFLVSTYCVLGTLYSDSEGDQAQPLVTGIQGEVNTQNMKIHAHLCAKIPLKSKKKKKKYPGVQREDIFQDTGFWSGKEQPRGPFQSHSPAEASLRGPFRTPSHHHPGGRKLQGHPPASSDVCFFMYDTVGILKEGRKNLAPVCWA